MQLSYLQVQVLQCCLNSARDNLRSFDGETPWEAGTTDDDVVEEEEEDEVGGRMLVMPGTSNG